MKRSTASDHDVAAIAFDPSCGILAIGTKSGKIHLYGSPAAVGTLDVPQVPGTREGSEMSIKFLAFSGPLQLLICVGETLTAEICT